MMKKLYKFSAIAALLLSCGLASCTHEEADIFDKSAAQRTEEARQMYKDILVDKGGKWQMEYFTTESEHGYIYLFTFRNDGTVTISGNNEYITKLTNVDSSEPTYGSETSLWTVLSDNGPVLSLNSYNTIFHLFANPEDVPGTDRDEQGYGHTGDYEFDLMKYSGDTLYLEGKKHGANIIMTRIAADTEDKTYLDEVVALTDSFFNAKVPTVYLNLPGGYRYKILNGSTQLPSFFPETGDSITESQSRNAIITHDGFTLGKSITLRDSIDGQDYTVQHFVRQNDGSLLCREDNRITISADALNKVVGDVRLLWRVDASASKGEFGSLLSAINTGLKAYNGASLVYLNFGLNVVDNVKYPQTMLLRIRTKRGAYLNMRTPFTVEYSGSNQIKFVLGELDVNLQTYITRVPALKTFVEKLTSTTFSCSSSSLLAPVKMNLTDSQDASSVLTLNIQ